MKWNTSAPLSIKINDIDSCKQVPQLVFHSSNTNYIDIILVGKWSMRWERYMELLSWYWKGEYEDIIYVPLLFITDDWINNIILVPKKDTNMDVSIDIEVIDSVYAGCISKYVLGSNFLQTLYIPHGYKCVFADLLSGNADRYISYNKREVRYYLPSMEHGYIITKYEELGDIANRSTATSAIITLGVAALTAAVVYLYLKEKRE